MNLYRFILVLTVLGTTATCCHGQSQRQNIPVIPDGEYRDAGGSYILTVTGKTAVLMMKFPKTTVTLDGPVAFDTDGDFYLSHQASNQYFMYFVSRNWRWETDHFVVKESVPPNRTLKLERK